MEPETYKSPEPGYSMALVDNIIGNHFVDDATSLFRARVLVISWILFLAALIFFGLLTALLPMKQEARVIGVVLAGVISFLLLVMMWRFRHSGNLKLFARVSVGTAFVGIAISVFVASSPITSPGIGLFYIVPLLAVFYLGRQSGIRWLLATLSLLMLLVVLETLSFPFLSMYDEEFFLETKLSSMTLGMIGVLGMVYAYEYANKKLREQRDAEYQRLAFLADHDELTGLANRNRFESDIERSIARLGIASRSEKMALLYLDLDGFKPVNDVHGHEAGDKVLQVVARRIERLLHDRGYAARHGGDEFLVLLESVTSDQEARRFAEELAMLITGSIDFRGKTLHIKSSIGIAMFPRDAQDIVSLIKHADMSMYHAKQNKLGCSLFNELE